MSELTERQSLALSRLHRCARWAESNRSPLLITLDGVNASGTMMRYDFDALVLTELLKLGLIECDVSQRIVETPYSANPKPHEVTQRYWRVL